MPCTRSALTARLTMEAYNSSIGEFAYERAMFHNVCPDGEAFVRRGLSFLQGQVQKRWK